MIRLTRRYGFSASHRLHSDALDEAANRELYGKCNNPFGHGHNYLLEVSVRGPVDELSGQAVQMDMLDALVRRSVLVDFDRRNLNLDIEEFRREVPTSENILSVIQARLADKWPSAFPGQWPVLDQVRLRETRNNSFELKS